MFKPRNKGLLRWGIWLVGAACVCGFSSCVGSPYIKDPNAGPSAEPNTLKSAMPTVTQESVKPPLPTRPPAIPGTPDIPYLRDLGERTVRAVYSLGDTDEISVRLQSIWIDLKTMKVYAIIWGGPEGNGELAEEYIRKNLIDGPHLMMIFNRDLTTEEQEEFGFAQSEAPGPYERYKRATEDFFQKGGKEWEGPARISQHVWDDTPGMQRIFIPCVHLTKEQEAWFRKNVIDDPDIILINQASDLVLD